MTVAKVCWISFAAVFLVSAGGAASAQPALDGDQLQQVCRADYDRYCPPYEGRRRGLAECIHDHLSQASPTCRSAVRHYVAGLHALAAQNPRLRSSALAAARMFSGEP